MVSRSFIRITVYFLMLFLLTGCWDQVNIEEHGFIIGTAIDKVRDETDGDIKLSMTNQMVSPVGLGTPSSEGNDEEPFINLTTSGESIFAVNRKLLRTISRPPFYEHLRVLIVSADVAHDTELFASMLDVFLRDQEMRRGIKVIIAEDKAMDILDINPKPEKLPVIHIDMITENTYKSMDMIKPVTLGEIHSYLLNESSYILPKISINENRVNYNGAAVFNGLKDKMVGSLSGLETKGLNLMKGDINGGVINFKVEDHIMAFNLEGTKSKINVNPEDPKSMEVSINIKAEGDLAEMYGSKTLLNPSYIAKMEGKIAERIEQIAKQTIEKAQKEYELDILNIDEVLKRKHYPIWKKIKKDWEAGENYFANSRINVSADVQIREVGATDRAKSKEHEYIN